MAKTQETLDLEAALDQQSRAKREYGCEEVTIGFKKSGHGDEIVDYMTMDAKAVFKCYEIKVTLSDLKTENKKSFYGDYNYLVVTDELYAKNPVWDNYIPPYTGILAGTELNVKRTARKKDVKSETKEMLKDSLLRSLFWKMENYKDAKDLENLRNIKKQLLDQQTEMTQKSLADERMIWTYQDYEHYYRLNHQAPQYSLESAAKQERKETDLRMQGKYTWMHQNDNFICPACKNTAPLDSTNQPVLSNFCPFCGADLRDFKK